MAQSCPILCNPVALIGISLTIDTGLPWWLSGKNAGDTGDSSSISGSGRSPEKEVATTSVFLPGKFHGQRSLAGDSLWGHKESDTTGHHTQSCTEKSCSHL